MCLAERWHGTLNPMTIVESKIDWEKPVKYALYRVFPVRNNLWQAGQRTPGIVEGNAGLGEGSR
jgi:hypothetical protein